MFLLLTAMVWKVVKDSISQYTAVYVHCKTKSMVCSRQFWTLRGKWHVIVSLLLTCYNGVNNLMGVVSCPAHLPHSHVKRWNLNYEVHIQGVKNVTLNSSYGWCDRLEIDHVITRSLEYRLYLPLGFLRCSLETNGCHWGAIMAFEERKKKKEKKTWK